MRVWFAAVACAAMLCSWAAEGLEFSVTIDGGARAVTFEATDQPERVARSFLSNHLGSGFNDQHVSQIVAKIQQTIADAAIPGSGAAATAGEAAQPPTPPTPPTPPAAVDPARPAFTLPMTVRRARSADPSPCATGALPDDEARAGLFYRDHPDTHA